jgi:hypothetical protein
MKSRGAVTFRWARGALALALFAVAWLGGAQPGIAAAPAERLTVSGSQLLGPDGKPVWLRGFNWGRHDTAQPEDGKGNAERGANVVRIPFRWYFEGSKADMRMTSAPGHFEPEALKRLDQHIKWATDAGLWVVLFGGSDKGAGGADENYWTKPALRQEYKEAWAFIVQRYKDTPRIAAYELLSEPHPKKPATTADLRSFYEEMIATVRRYDTRTPVVIGADDHYAIDQLQGVYTKVDDKIIYAANFYLPKEYCKSWRRKELDKAPIAYPGPYVDRSGASRQLDKAALEGFLKPALDFRERNRVPVFIDQVGCMSATPGVLEYTKDTLAMMRKYQMHWAFWTYRVNHAGPREHGLWYDDGTGWKLKTDLDAVLRAAMAP